jgi:hypothetical protein
MYYFHRHGLFIVQVGLDDLRAELVRDKGYVECAALYVTLVDVLIQQD